MNIKMLLIYKCHTLAFWTVTRLLRVGRYCILEDHIVSIFRQYLFSKMVMPAFQAAICPNAEDHDMNLNFSLTNLWVDFQMWFTVEEKNFIIISFCHSVISYESGLSLWWLWEYSVWVAYIKLHVHWFCRLRFRKRKIGTFFSVFLRVNPKEADWMQVARNPWHPVSCYLKWRSVTGCWRLCKT
jgi:hypothetical protein